MWFCKILMNNSHVKKYALPQKAPYNVFILSSLLLSRLAKFRVDRTCHHKRGIVVEDIIFHYLPYTPHTVICWLCGSLNHPCCIMWQVDFPVWVNADILRGPGQTAGDVVEPKNFLATCVQKFPIATISAGWTVDVKNAKNRKSFHFLVPSSTNIPSRLLM